MNPRHRRLVYAGALALSLILSLVFYFLPPRIISQRILFFPLSGAATNHLSGEIHYLPNRASRLQEAQDLVQTMLQGPLSLGYVPLCPSDTKLISIFQKDQMLHVNLGVQFFGSGPRLYLEPGQRVQTLKDSILHNFPEYHGVKVYIRGQELGAWPYTGKRKA